LHLQKPIERSAGFKPKQAAQLGFGQMTELTFFQGQRVERAALDLAGGADGDLKAGARPKPSCGTAP